MPRYLGTYLRKIRDVFCLIECLNQWFIKECNLTPAFTFEVSNSLKWLEHNSGFGKVSLLGDVVLWGDCMFIPADWGS